MMNVEEFMHMDEYKQQLKCLVTNVTLNENCTAYVEQRFKQIITECSLDMQISYS
jgi:hypothetical protein